MGSRIRAEAGSFLGQVNWFVCVRVCACVRVCCVFLCFLCYVMCRPFHTFGL